LVSQRRDKSVHAAGGVNLHNKLQARVFVILGELAVISSKKRGNFTTVASLITAATARQLKLQQRLEFLLRTI
jgi:hypothetical protein